MHSPGTTSGPPCNVESMRQEIQQTYEADLKRAVMSEQRAADELEKTQVRLAKHTKRADNLELSVKKLQNANSAMKSEIVRSEKADKGAAANDLKSMHKH